MRNAIVGISLLVIATGCGTLQQTQHPQQQTSASWAFQFVVLNGRTYKLTSEAVDRVGKQIGTVTSYSDKEGTYSGNFSNTFPVGTQLFEISSTDPKKAIAIGTGNGLFTKAIDQGK